MHLLSENGGLLPLHHPYDTLHVTQLKSREVQTKRGLWFFFMAHIKLFAAIWSLAGKKIPTQLVSKGGRQRDSPHNLLLILCCLAKALGMASRSRWKSQQPLLADPEEGVGMRSPPFEPKRVMEAKTSAFSSSPLHDWAHVVMHQELFNLIAIACDQNTTL